MLFVAYYGKCYREKMWFLVRKELWQQTYFRLDDQNKGMDPLEKMHVVSYKSA